jgi:hypothetical protein
MTFACRERCTVRAEYLPQLRRRPREKFGRVHHLAADWLARVVDGMWACGLVDASGWVSDAGRKTKKRIESLTDVAAPAYSSLEPSELDQLIARPRALEPISATFDATGSRQGPALAGASARFADDQRNVALGAVLVSGVALVGRHHAGPQLGVLLR